MAPVSVGFHPAAAQEAGAAYDWYAARDIFAAHAFREELRHAVDAVARNPLTWPRHGRRARRYVFPRFPFSLRYRMRDDEVEICGSRQAAAGLLAVSTVSRRTSRSTGALARKRSPRPVSANVRRTERVTDR